MVEVLNSITPDALYDKINVLVEVVLLKIFE